MVHTMKKKNPMNAVRHKKPKKTVRKSTSRKKSSSNKKARWIWGILFLVALAGIGYTLFESKKPLTVANFRNKVPAGFESIGIDVSHHQGKIDWEELMETAGFDTIIHFVYCKATEGSDHLDSRWTENRTKLNSMGILNGAYHFFSPKTPPRPQAVHFLTHWKKREIDLPPVLDVETEGFSDEDLIAKMKIWLEEVETTTGMRPIIYTSLNFYETKFQNEFKNYPFWIAAYSRKPACIHDERIIHWQFTESGSLPGINEAVDLNVSKIIF